MNKRKKYMIRIGIILFVIVGIGIIYFMNNKEKETYITKYEWVEMLAQEIGITESLNSTPYFEDVLEDNEYFSIIQSSVEWGLLEDETEFNGDSYVTGEFMALTIMKTINDEKIQIFLNTRDVITEEEYLSIAIELGIIEEDKLQEYYSIDEAVAVLEKYREAYFNKFWFDDYEVVEYSANVVGITSEEILQGDESATNIVVSSETLNKLSIGKIIVFEYGNNNSKYARKIISINPDGSLILSDDIRIDEVLNSLIVSDVEEISFDDLKEDYVTRNTTNQTQTLAYQKSNDTFLNTKVFSGDLESKGFKISVSSTDKKKKEESKEKKDNLEVEEPQNSTKEDNANKEKQQKDYLEVKITDNLTGISFSTLIEDTTEVENDFAVEIDIDKMYIGAQFNYSVLEGVKYVDVAIDSHATTTGSIVGFDEEKKIPLFETSVPLGKGTIEANVQIFLVLAADGSISFKAEVPVETAIYYEKEKSIRNFDTEVSVEEPHLEANGNASVMIRLEPILRVVDAIDVIDIETDAGIVASAKQTNALKCTDISASTPVITIQVGADDEVDTLIDALGLSAEWNIIEPENAPFILKFHLEKGKDGLLQLVDECTYKEQMNEEGTVSEVTKTTTEEAEYDDISFLYGYTYAIEFWPNSIRTNNIVENGTTFNTNVYDVIDNGSGYIVTGCLYYFEKAPAMISTLAVGDTFNTTSNKEYTITEQIYDANGRGTFYLSDAEGNEYVVYNVLSSSFDELTGKPYYQIIYNGAYLEVLLEDVTFFVPYGSALEEWLKYASLGGGGEAIDSFVITFDEKGNVVDYISR